MSTGPERERAIYPETEPFVRDDAPVVIAFVVCGTGGFIMGALFVVAIWALSS